MLFMYERYGKHFGSTDDFVKMDILLPTCLELQVPLHIHVYVYTCMCVCRSMLVMYLPTSQQAELGMLSWLA